MNEERELIEAIDEQSLSLMEDSPEASSEILYEDTSKRSENVKHFRMKNGTYMAAVYDKPVHTMDKSTGKFVDIAHRFEAKEDCYEAETDHFKARFPKKEGKRKYVTMEKGESSVSWRYIPTTDSHKKRAEASIHEHTRASLDELPQFPKLTYEKTEAQTDLEYGISEKGVKENIILTKRPKSNIFRFELKLVGLKAILSEDNKSIQLYAENADGGESEFVIPPINMTDGAGVYSEAAHYELTEDENGTVMAVVIDPEWLFAEERLYPVTVDPQIYVAIENVTNAFLSIKSNNTKVTSGATHKVGFDSNGIEHRIYMKPTYPELPDGAKVTSAVLNLYQSSYVGSAEYDLCKITEEWDTSSLSWANQPVFRTCNPLDTMESKYRYTITAIPLDITNEAMYWYKNGYRNYGFVLKAAYGTNPGCTSTGNNNTTCTKEQYMNIFSYTGDKSKPSVQVQYKLVDEYADHQKYESFSAGRAGSGSVNLFTGKLAFTHTDVVASGGKLPLSLSHIYRSDYADINPSDVVYGRGWRLSAAQTLNTSDSAQDVVATYIDANGRKHYFVTAKDSTGNTAYDEDGNIVYHDNTGLQIYYDGANTITDEKGNSLTFNSTGKLTKITDANGNSNTMTYTNNLLTKITDGMGRTATLKYSSNKLTGIVDYKSRTTSFTYDTSNRLTQISYPDGTYTCFSYSGGKLTRITDFSGILYDINYESNNDCRVTEITKKGTKKVSRGSVTSHSAINGGGFSFEYRTRSTAVKDLTTNIQTVNCFDECGRVCSSYEDLTKNSSLAKSAVTITDLAEYEVVLNHRSNTNTNGRYAGVKVGITAADMHKTNLLANGSLTSNSVGTLQPSGWSVTSVLQNKDGVVSDSYLDGYNSYRFDNTCNRRTKQMQQRVTLCSDCIDGNMLIASAWAKATQPVNSATGNSKFELYAVLTYSDGTSLERTAQFDCGCTDWQYVAVPLEITPGKIPSSVLVKFDFSGNSGTCLVSNLRLIEARGTYTHINNRVVGTNAYHTVFGPTERYQRSVLTSNGLETKVTYYNANSDAVKTHVSDSEGHAFLSYAQYDDKHQPIKTRDYRGIQTEYTYDSFGNVTSTKTYHKDDSSRYFYNKSAYSSTTGRLLRSYDSRDDSISTGYSYDTKSDLLTQRTDPNGQIYKYGHNSNNDLQTSVTAFTDDCYSNDPTNTFAYDANYLTQVTHNGYTFKFDYDELGRNSSIKSADNGLVSLAYTNGESSTVTTNYANGYTTVVTMDSRGNPVKKTMNGSELSVAEYDPAGNPSKVIDNARKVCYTYSYNKDGNLSCVEERPTNSSTLIGRHSFGYDSEKRPISHYDARTGHTYNTIYEERTSGVVYPDNVVKGVRLSSKYTDQITRDTLRRVSARNLTLNSASSPLITDSYSYLQSNGRETSFVKKLSHQVNSKTVSMLDYTYDRMGNIETVTKDGTILVKYTYDGMNRLIYEDNYNLMYRYQYTYDDGGNITYKTIYTLLCNGSPYKMVNRITYRYDSTWKDKLISYENNYSSDTEITYDSLGNPTLYRGNKLTWTNVRRLASYGSNTFAYGADGIRYKKNSTTYTLDGSKIVKETDGSKTLIYYYGANGVIGFNYNGADYYYLKNLQGDIIAIYTANGVLVAEYLYDAWGKALKITNHSSANIGSINPFRYRGYYYDVETGLYYLQTRYYDPEVGRFINSDALEYLGDGVELSNYNLFAYCGDNPVNYRDPRGNVLGIIAGLGLGIGVLLTTLFIPSDVDQRPKYEATAKAKYNSNTVNVYNNGEGKADPNKLNARVYDAGEYININIDGSLEINSKYEMNAVLDVIMQSEYYDEDLFGSKGYMRAQWAAHNWNYTIASSGDLGYNAMKIMSGSENPIESGSKLDIRSKGNMLLRHKIVYKLIELFY